MLLFIQSNGCPCYLKLLSQNSTLLIFSAVTMQPWEKIQYLARDALSRTHTSDKREQMFNTLSTLCHGNVNLLFYTVPLTQLFLDCRQGHIKHSTICNESMSKSNIQSCKGEALFPNFHRTLDIKIFYFQFRKL